MHWQGRQISHMKQITTNLDCLSFINRQTEKQNDEWKNRLKVSTQLRSMTLENIIQEAFQNLFG